MKLLLDNCIITGSELAEPAEREKTVQWGDSQITANETGYKKRIFDDEGLQKQIDALPTVGRLIRENTISAFTYNELEFESFRRSVPIKAFYALKDCHIAHCNSPIERSKFRRTIDLGEHISKGGKKDKNNSGALSEFNQIPFIEWLLQLSEEDVKSIINIRDDLALTDFEVESLNQIGWLKFVCGRFQSRENYPDAFHLWAAERNQIDVFLTLEKKLPNNVNQIRQSKNQKHHIKTMVLRPIEFLEHIGIVQLDDAMIAPGAFYTFMDGHNNA